MPVQTGGRSLGYDKSQTLDEQIADATGKLAAVAAGSVMANHLTQHIADLNAKKAETTAAQARAVAEEAAERAKNPSGLVAVRSARV